MKFFSNYDSDKMLAVWIKKKINLSGKMKSERLDATFYANILLVYM